jgi:hypothetical protein
MVSHCLVPLITMLCISNLLSSLSLGFRLYKAPLIVYSESLLLMYSGYKSLDFVDIRYKCCLGLVTRHLRFLGDDCQNLLSCFKLLKAIFIVSPLTLNTSTEAVVTFFVAIILSGLFIYIPLSILLLSELCLNIRIILVFVNVMFTLVTLRLAAISSEDNSSLHEPKRCSII